MGKGIEGQGRGFTPPSDEELQFRDVKPSGMTRNSFLEEQRNQLEKLIGKQRIGIDQDIRPRFPRGLDKSLKPKWHSQVWDEWLKIHPEGKRETFQGQQLHSHPTDPPSTLRTTLRRRRTTFPSDVEE